MVFVRMAKPSPFAEGEATRSSKLTLLKLAGQDLNLTCRHSAKNELDMCGTGGGAMVLNKSQAARFSVTARLGAGDMHMPWPTSIKSQSL